MKFNRDERRLRALAGMYREATAEEMRPDFLRRLKELEANREKLGGDMNATGIKLVNAAIKTSMADLRSVRSA